MTAVTVSIVFAGGGVGVCQASTAEAWAGLDARSNAACSEASGLQAPRVGAPIRFGDLTGIDVRVVTGHDAQAQRDSAPTTLVCAFHRASGRAEVVAPAEDSMLTELPAAPSIVGIVWRAEDIGGRGIIDSSRATIEFGADGGVAGSASCNAFAGRYSLERGTLSIAAPVVTTRRACPPALMNQESRFLAILVDARRIELLPTGALLVTAADGRTLRFFPETPLRPGFQAGAARLPQS